MNGSAAIHDFEIALAGHTSEDVEAVLPDGRFGAAEETGREMNRAIAGGDREGSAWARRSGGWLARRAEHARVEPAAAGVSAARPVTVHVAIGTDTPHTHPAADGGGDRQRDASRFPPVCSYVTELHDGGVYLKWGRRWCCRRYS